MMSSIKVIFVLIKIICVEVYWIYVYWVVCGVCIGGWWMRLLGDGYLILCLVLCLFSEFGKGLSRGLMLVFVLVLSRGMLVFEV